MDTTDEQVLSSFFKNVVQVPAQCSYEDYIDELRACKEEGCTDIDVIKVWYEALDQGRGKNEAAWAEMRYSLDCGPSGLWSG